MGFLSRLFGSQSYDVDQPDIKFGRFSDAYKKQDRYDAWDEALDLFEKKQYFDSYRKFFYYLSDEDAKNVHLDEKEDRLDFILYQGSKQIEGFINSEKVKAEAKIARTKDLNIGFLRRLLEQNYSLRYSRYALDGQDDITILFDSYLIDGAPYKLYYALKEVAVNADKLDDLLIDEFEVLEDINTAHIESLPPEECSAKVNYLKSEIKDALDYIDSAQLNIEQYPGGIAYLLLDLMYRLDYLVAPEGPSMETIERMHRTYFAKDGNNMLQKVLELRKELQSLYEKDFDDCRSELYRVISTFGVTSPVEHEKIKSIIAAELQHMDWFIENKHEKVARAIPTYIVGYCLFNYAVPVPDKALFELYFQVMEHEYFRKLGFTLDFVNDQGELNERSIRNALGDIKNKFEEKYPHFDPRSGELEFDSKVVFARSFMKMVHDLDLSEKKK